MLKNNHKKRQDELHSVSESDHHNVKIREEEPTMSRFSSSLLLHHPISAWSPDRRRPVVQEVDPLPGPSGCVTSYPSTCLGSAGWWSRHELQRRQSEKFRNTSSSLAECFTSHNSDRLPPSLPFSGECGSGDVEASEMDPF